MSTARPLPSQVEAALGRGLPRIEDVRVLLAHLDNDPVALSWPSAARMHVRSLVEEIERCTRVMPVDLRRVA